MVNAQGWEASGGPRPPFAALLNSSVTLSHLLDHLLLQLFNIPYVLCLENPCKSRVTNRDSRSVLGRMMLFVSSADDR